MSAGSLDIFGRFNDVNKARGLTVKNKYRQCIYGQKSLF